MRIRKSKQIVPYEDSYPYNVLYDVLKSYQIKDDITLPKDELRKYSISEFENYMTNRLDDIELRCIECIYRFGMNYTETSNHLEITDQVIRIHLNRGFRKLRGNLISCMIVSKEEFDILKQNYEDLNYRYDRLLNGLIDASKNLSTANVNNILYKKDAKNNRLCINTIHNESIDVLKLSPRAYNCLKRNGIKTIKDIILNDSKPDNYRWLFKIRGMGKKSADEIRKQMLDVVGYDLNKY